MAEQNSGNINFNNEELPIPIPPADQAWQSMRQKLDAELPVQGNLPARVHIRYLWIKGVFVMTAIAAAGVLLWQYNRKPDTQLLSSHNNVYDTNPTYKQSVSPLPDSHIQSTDTTFRHTPSPAINGAADGVSHAPVSSSQREQDPQSSQTQEALQSSATQQHSTSSASLQPSLIADSQHPTVGKTTTQSIAEQLAKGKQPLKQLAVDDHPLIKKESTTTQHVTDKQLATGRNLLSEQKTIAKQQTTDKHPSKPFASDRKTSGKTVPIAASEPSATQKKQSSANAYKNTDLHVKETHPSLQLSLIQSPIKGYNTSLQHKADPLVLRQPGHKHAEKAWALYVQLNAALPLYDSSFYFLGPNGKDQFYRRLIPAVRIERKLWKGALSLDIQPSVSVIPKTNIQADVGSQWSPFDTTRSLLKQFGWGLALQYQIPVHPKWQVGAGLQASFLQKAVMRQTIKDSMRIIQNGAFPASAADKQDLSRLSINGVAEVDYWAGKWQFGLRTLVPVTRISKKRDISARPVNVEVVVRRRLWSK